MSNIIRVLMAKPGLDGHDRGAKVVARALRDAGFEVIYTGLHQTPEMIKVAAVQEDVDIVGLSILSGAHLPLVHAIKKAFKAEKINKPIFVGGIIPESDASELKRSGIEAVFGPGSSLNEITKAVKEVVEKGCTELGIGKKSKIPTKKTKTLSKKTKKKTWSKKTKKKILKKTTKKKAKKKQFKKNTKY